MAFDAIVNISKDKMGTNSFREFSLNIPQKKYEPYEVYELPSECIKKCDAVGRVCAEFVAPYPPGVPVVVPGEIISEDVYDYLEEWINVIK